jgi:hypothetical protein
MSASFLFQCALPKHESAYGVEGIATQHQEERRNPGGELLLFLRTQSTAEAPNLLLRLRFLPPLGRFFASDSHLGIFS